MTPFSDRPTQIVCPKCDSWLDEVAPWKVRYHEEQHQSPDFQSGPASRNPHLDWYCPECGYSVQTECADAAKVLV